MPFREQHQHPPLREQPQHTRWRRSVKMMTPNTPITPVLLRDPDPAGQTTRWLGQLQSSLGQRGSSLGTTVGSHIGSIGLQQAHGLHIHTVGSRRGFRRRPRRRRGPLNPRWRRVSAISALFTCTSAQRPTLTRWQRISETRRQQFSSCVAPTGMWRRGCKRR